MADEILVFNGSRSLDRSIPLEVLAEVAKIRDLTVSDIEGSVPIIDFYVEKLFNHERGQVNADDFIYAFNKYSGVGAAWREGKLILLDADLYSGAASNWCFGGCKGTEKGPGYIIISTARLKDEVVARHLLRHELGHLFRAPAKGRSNTEQNLGTHCLNDMCVMQQRLTVDSAIDYAHQVRDAGKFPYCNQCVINMKRYKVLE